MTALKIVLTGIMVFVAAGAAEAVELQTGDILANRGSAVSKINGSTGAETWISNPEDLTLECMGPSVPWPCCTAEDTSNGTRFRRP